MGFYEKHIFVCENIREEGKRVSCGRANTKKHRELLKLLIKEKLPEAKIRVNMSGCLDRCELGPVVVSYPEGKWFCLKTEKDVSDFVNSYVILGQTKDIEHLVIPD